jgi:glycosyltransferase involved in cell wall biosynthesis
MSDKARILVSSVGGWSDANGSNTLSSLVAGYDKDALACIYIRSEGSDSSVCDRYFHIFESEVLKSLYNGNVHTGEAFAAGQSKGAEQDRKQKELYSHFVSFRPYSLILARELIWKWGKWRSPELDAFLDEFKPDVLFFPIEGYIHFNRLNEYIIARCKPKKVIGYLWDDNFSYRIRHWNPLWWLHRAWLRRGVKRLVKTCDTLFAISPKMQREIKELLQVDSVLLTKPATMNACQEVFAKKNLSLLYTGNMTAGRDRSLEIVAQAIEKLNREGGAQLHLDIYTQTPQTRRMKKKLNIPHACTLHSAVPQSEVFRLQKEADILLFVESFEAAGRFARLSFSTKITDYLSSGRAIWAIGPSDLAPIEYFEKNACALVSSGKNNIEADLRKWLDNASLLSEYAARALDCARKNHDEKMIRERFEKASGIQF